MSKLLEDPKIAALVDKQVAKAVKAETARVLTIVKTEANCAKDIESKDVKKVVTTILRDIATHVKAAA